MRVTKLAKRFWVSADLLARLRGGRYWLVTLGWLGVAIATAPQMSLKSAQAAVLSEWRFDAEANQLEIMLPQGMLPRYSILNQPPRVVIDFPSDRAGAIPTQQSYSGIVRQIRVGELQRGWTRIVLEFDPTLVLDASQVQLQRGAAPLEIGAFRDRWVLRTPIPDARTSPAPSPTAVATNRGSIEKYPPLQTNLNSNQTTESSYPSEPSGEQTSQTESSYPSEPSGEQSSQMESSYPNLPSENRSSQSEESEESQSMPESSMLPALPQERSALPYTSPSTVVVPALGARSSGKYGRGIAVSSVAVRGEPDIFLPAGTVLNLRYSGDKTVMLDRGVERQEVLVLQEEIRDRNGNLIANPGTPIIGRFDTNRRGSRFIAQGIALFGRNLPLSGESERIKQLNVLEPGQILQIRLNEDLR